MKKIDLSSGLIPPFHPFRHAAALAWALLACAHPLAFADNPIIPNQGVCHGPVFRSWKAKGSKAIVTFDSVGKGLEARAVTLDGHPLSADTLAGFELGDKEQRFFRAKAEVKGLNTVVVSSPKVLEPVSVRYGWATFPLCNLYNK